MMCSLAFFRMFFETLQIQYQPFYDQKICWMHKILLALNSNKTDYERKLKKKTNNKRQ